MNHKLPVGATSRRDRQAARPKQRSCRKGAPTGEQSKSTAYDMGSWRATCIGPMLPTGHEPAVVGHVVRVSGLRDIELRHVARCASNVTYNSKSIIYDMESVAKQSSASCGGLLNCFDALSVNPQRKELIWHQHGCNV